MSDAEEYLDKRAKAHYKFKDQSLRAVTFSDALEAIRLARKEEQSKMIDAKGIEMIVRDHVDQAGFKKVLDDVKKEVEARVRKEEKKQLIMVVKDYHDYRERDAIKTRLETAKKIFGEIQKIIWNRGKDSVANIRYTELGKLENHFLSKYPSGHKVSEKKEVGK